MRWALPLLVIAHLASAQVLSKSIRSGGLSPERFPTSGAGAGAAPVTDLLNFLPGVAVSDECTGAALSATTGQPLTFTRGSSAYCTKSDGTLALLTNNLPRVETNGLLTEEPRTNVALRSQELEHAAWAKGATGFVTANTGSAPDGTTTADQVQLSGAASNGFVQQAVAGVYEAATHTFSCYVRSNTGGSQGFRLKLTHSAVLDYFSPDRTATASWQRFTFSQLFGGAAGSGATVGVVTNSVSASADLLVWGCQLEKGQQLATSYIATAGTTVVRSTELGTFSLTLPEAEGCATAAITFPSSKTSGSLYIVGTSGGSNSDAPIYWPSGAGFLGTFSTAGGGPLVAATLVNTTSTGRSAWRTLPSLFASIQVNGGTAATQAGYDLAPAALLCLGGTCASGSQFTGYIRALRIGSSFGGCL